MDGPPTDDVIGKVQWLVSPLLALLAFLFGQGAMRKWWASRGQSTKTLAGLAQRIETLEADSRMSQRDIQALKSQGQEMALMLAREYLKKSEVSDMISEVKATVGRLEEKMDTLIIDLAKAIGRDSSRR